MKAVLARGSKPWLRRKPQRSRKLVSVYSASRRDASEVPIYHRLSAIPGSTTARNPVSQIPPSDGLKAQNTIAWGKASRASPQEPTPNKPVEH